MKQPEAELPSNGKGILGADSAAPTSTPLDALIAKWREKRDKGLSVLASLREMHAHEAESYERGKADARNYCADELEAALAASPASALPQNAPPEDEDTPVAATSNSWGCDNFAEGESHGPCGICAGCMTRNGADDWSRNAGELLLAAAPTSTPLDAEPFYRYSGWVSTAFWRWVGSLDEERRNKAYELGCQIQELECELHRLAASPASALPLDKRLDEVRALPENWDGYGATPIDPGAIEAARLFLQRASVVPCSSGGVQLEWHTHGLDLELEFEPGGTVIGYLETVAPVAPASALVADKGQK